MFEYFVLGLFDIEKVVVLRFVFDVLCDISFIFNRFDFNFIY